MGVHDLWPPLKKREHTLHIQWGGVFFGFIASACMARSVDMVNLLRVAVARGVIK